MSRIAQLSALLGARHLDRTLVPTDATADRHLPVHLPVYLPFDLPELDARVAGLPRGQISELIGPRSSGRTTVMHAVLAAATAREELTAVVDALDTFDPPSAAAAGVDLRRVLWVRGPSIAHQPLTPSQLFHTAAERAVKAFNLILQAGPFGLVVLDVADLPPATIGRLPFTTWLRLQRAIEGRDIAGLLVADTGASARAGLGRSARGLTLRFEAASLGAAPQQSPWQPMQADIHLAPFSAHRMSAPAWPTVADASHVSMKAEG